MNEDATKFNRIQYQNFLASVIFMQGKDFERVMREADTGIKLCKEFTWAPLKGEADNMLTEFEGMKLKALARKDKTNALEIKDQYRKQKALEKGEPDDEELKAMTAKGTFSAATALTTFTLTTGAVYAGFMAYNKLMK
jgi:hypothetical protein